MTPSAAVQTFLFLHIGVILVATAYYGVSAAMLPGLAERSRARMARGMWAPIAIGLLVSAPWVFVALAAMSAGAAAVKFAGAALLTLWVLCGLLGGAGIALHIGRDPRRTDGPTWTDCLRGGLLLSLTWILPFVGWLVMLPLTLATGIGCIVLGAFGRRSHESQPIAVHAD